MTIADQLMLLAPGRYVFGANMKGDVAYGGGGFAWTVSCVGASAPLGDAMLAASRAAGRLATAGAAPTRTPPVAADAATLSFEFTVPATGCPAQRLTLEGRPGEFPKRARSTTAWVNIAPVQAAAVAPQRAPKGAAAQAPP